MLCDLLDGEWDSEFELVGVEEEQGVAVGVVVGDEDGVGYELGVQPEATYVGEGNGEEEVASLNDLVVFHALEAVELPASPVDYE